ncbi:unnamed protein product [Orchesella dallaii]|uniref:Alkyl transferase n=1 Tax=Orchesella dallaii TaxID=48710 RepID=A0ABP1S4E1_9HEXA
MTTWIKDDEHTWIQKFCKNILKMGPIPKHLGFILDGNRRYAKGNNMGNVDGHKKGFDKLSETLRWCLDLGVEEVTVYAFSIENFKRSSDEVNGLMLLAKEKFEKLLEEKDEIHRIGVCIEVIGDWSLVPLDLKQLMAKAMVMTKNNSKLKLRVAFAYTARNEMMRGVNSLITGVSNGELVQADVSEALLEDAFQIHPPRDLDLLVRTSGELRLSDFLLWQSSETVICFTDVLWPDFTYWHLLAAVFQYQINCLSLSKMELTQPEISQCPESERRKTNFADRIRSEKWARLNLDSESHVAA